MFSIISWIYLDYYAAQRQIAAQRVQQQQQEEPSSHPVGIRVRKNHFSFFFNQSILFSRIL
jgi:hypothetical protein